MMGTAQTRYGYILCANEKSQLMLYSCLDAKNADSSIDCNQIVYNHVLFVLFSNALCTTKQQSNCSIVVASLCEEHGVPEVGRERQIQEIPKKHIDICETVISGKVRPSHTRI